MPQRICVYFSLRLREGSFKKPLKDQAEDIENPVCKEPVDSDKH